MHGQADVAEYLGPNPDVESALKEFQSALAYVTTLSRRGHTCQLSEQEISLHGSQSRSAETGLGREDT